MSDNLTPSQIEAAQEIAQFAHEEIVAKNAATVISGTARMAGTFLFRSFDFRLHDSKPGDAVLSDKANEEGPRLMQILGGVLSYLGIDVGEQFVESSSSDDQPALEFLDTTRILEPRFDEIRRKHGLSYEGAAEATAAAVAILIKEYSDILNKDVAFGIGVYGFIEGTKTVPLPLPKID